MEEIYLVRRGLTDRTNRKLIITPKQISFENKNVGKNLFTTIDSSNISEFRFGIKWYQYDFVFGREYQIFIRTTENEIFKINFNSYFGYRKKELWQLYSEILNSIWQKYFLPKVDILIQKVENGETIKIGEVQINNAGVTLKKNDSKIIPWGNLETIRYETYFALYSKINPEKLNKGFSYLLDWNTYLLRQVVESISRDKNSC